MIPNMISKDAENKEITGNFLLHYATEDACDFSYLGSIEQRPNENSNSIPISSLRLRPV